MEIYGNILWKTLYINFMSFYGILWEKNYGKFTETFYGNNYI